MKFTCEIDLENDAFEPESGGRVREVARILRSLAEYVEEEGIYRADCRTLQDINGNAVGMSKLV